MPLSEDTLTMWPPPTKHPGYRLAAKFGGARFDRCRLSSVRDPLDEAGNLGRVREICRVDGATELDRKRLEGIPAASD